MEQKVILLAEDNPDDEELTLMALRENNILNRVVTVRDGRETLDYFFGEGKFQGRSITDQPAITLLDIKMPKLDGLEVLKRLRSHVATRFCPVVILTSSKQEQDLFLGYERGANSYIRKPVDFDQFTQAIRQLGLYWLVLNEPPPAPAP
jgi:two-component system response regulator